MKKFKTATELNLAIKIASISIDAVNTYYEKQEKNIKTSKFNGRVVTAANVWSLLSKLIGNHSTNFIQKTWGLGKALTILAIIYAGGRRMASIIKDLLNKDPYKIESLPDPYEYIKREGVEYPGNKFKYKHKPDRSRMVDQDFYSDLNRDEPWYDEVQQQKIQQNLGKSGFPIDLGISPGFSAGDSRITDESFYNSMKKYNFSKNLMKVVAQSGGSFVSETINKIEGPQLAPNSANWINVDNWEQFLAQDPEGKWAAAPSMNASFYDPSRTLGRDKAMRWDPLGYGKDFYQEKIGDRLNVSQQRLEAFNEPEAQRQAAKIIFLNRQINLREKAGRITPNEAAKLREMLIMLQQQNNPEIAKEIEHLIRSAISGGFYTMPEQIDDIGMPSYQIDWETIQDPMDINPEYQRMIDKSLQLMDKYRKKERYQNILGDSDYLE